MINLVGVTKVYGKKPIGATALDGVTLRIEQGEFLGIMGPSGCGKSTLLNIIALLDSPTQGEYELFGRETASLSVFEKARIRNKTFGFVFQSPNLIKDYTVLGNVCLPLKYSAMSKRHHEGAAMAVLERLGIGHLRLKIPDELSGGEQQRVAIARALVNDPEAVVADEPTGNLDSKTGSSIVELFAKLCQETGKTIIMVTHDATVASFSRRVVLMSDGRIIDDTVLKVGEGSRTLRFYSLDESEAGYEKDVR